MPKIPLKLCNFESWLKRDSWAIEQAAFIILGFEPPPLGFLMGSDEPFGIYATDAYAIPNGYDHLLASIKSSITNGQLSSKKTDEGPYSVQHIMPHDVGTWAHTKGYEFPNTRGDIANQQMHLNVTTSFELKLPAEQRFLKVSEIPALTAAAIYPRTPKAKPTLNDIQKLLPGKSRPCPLDENDIAEIVNRIGDSLPEDWVNQFNKTRNDSEWKLIPVWEGDSQWLGQSMQRIELEEEHEKQLSEAIRRGELKPLNPLTYCAENYTVGDAGKRCLIPIEEFVLFAKRLRIRVLISTTNTQNNVEPGPGKDTPLTPILGSAEWRKQIAKTAANKKHDQPGGSRDKQNQIREIWTTGKYSTRDRCAEEECAALGMSFSAARKALRNV